VVPEILLKKVDVPPVPPKKILIFFIFWRILLDKLIFIFYNKKELSQAELRLNSI
jgi:hypothetical protein